MHQTHDLNDGYLGSGSAFYRAIKKYGKENFERTIIEFCSSFDNMVEKEKIYVDEDWVKRRDTYNLQIGGNHYAAYSEESRNKISNSLSETLKKKYENGYVHLNKGKKMSKEFCDKHKGISPPNKGIPMSEERKKKQSEAMKNKPAWNKGLKGVQQHTEESKRKLSEHFIEFYKIHEHASKGKPAWNRGLVGIYSNPNKGKPSIKEKCPHCGKEANAGNFQRWHGDNCKMKSKN